MKVICPAVAIEVCHNQTCQCFKPHTRNSDCEVPCAQLGKKMPICKPCADNGELALLCPDCGEPITQSNIGSFRLVNGIVTGVICAECFRKIKIEAANKMQIPGKN